MKHKRILIQNIESDQKVVLNTRTALYDKISNFLDEKDNSISQKLKFLDYITLLLQNKLENRIPPKEPQTLFISIDQLYVDLEIFGKIYSLQQGEENELILLYYLEKITRYSHETETRLIYTYFNTYNEIASL